MKSLVKGSVKTFAAVAVLALLASCSSPATEEAAEPAEPAVAVKACLALDTGGVDDKSFNASAWEGAQAAEAAGAEVKYLAATSDADYAPNIKKLVDEGCNIVIGVGFLINGAIVEAAKANPGTSFAIVDQDGQDHGPAGDQYPGAVVENLKGLQFATNQAAFQAGYLAAGYSKSGKVATYGGLNIPPVTIFMDGFARGVAHYNTTKGTKVVVLGWDIDKKDGTFVGGFSDQAKALQISKNFEQQGADVIFPVAGGLGSATANQSMTGKKSVTIWVDSDGFGLLTAGKSILLTTVVKEIGASIKSVAKDVAGKKFNGARYVGTLKNKGVSIAPYHDQSGRVPGALKLEVRNIRDAIIAGTLKVSA
jgi:basic membrane protein A